MKNIITSAVSVSSCSKHNAEKPFMLVLEKGEKLVESLVACAEKTQIKSASFFGIGALKNTELGFFDINQKAYLYKTFPKMYELISLTGNIIKHDEQYIVHAHVAIGDSDYKVTAGHLKEAEVALTAEISIIPFHAPISRQFNDDFNVCLVKANT